MLKLYISLICGDSKLYFKFVTFIYSSTVFILINNILVFFAFYTKKIFIYR
ncbi:hypothetical protein RO31_1944 [Francisella tularensis subsp. tularensis str. SCHU S4 substr. NR-28534]|nr:hypothetical protein RO31_1944 [Francisella tularensis subsp. tularensis str. SCHU S4 substr. NR-28534]